MLRLLVTLFGLAAIVAGCARAPDTANAAAAEERRTVTVPENEYPDANANDDAAESADLSTDRYLGTWRGVEGMTLVVARGAAPGRYRLRMRWDLDHEGIFTGTARRDTIAFDREGRHERLRPTDGQATALKYLAGKRDCLTVRPGEGYCRD